MHIEEILSIKDLYFTPKKIAEVLDINYKSAIVSCHRYEKQKLLIRIKRGIYTLSTKWGSLGSEELFRVANILEVPSYVSLQSALSYYGLSTQVQRDFVESISVKRTKNIQICHREFVFSRITKRLYSGFYKHNNFFIAEPEKAIIDALYLSSLNRYTLDLTAIDWDKISKKKVKSYLKSFPKYTKEHVAKCGIYQNMKR